MNGDSVYQKSREELLEIGKKFNIEQDQLEEFLEPDRVVELKIPVKIDGKNMPTMWLWLINTILFKLYCGSGCR